MHEATAGCCAAQSHYGIKVRNAKEIPAPATLTFIWLDATDKESIEYLGPIAKGRAEVGDKVMMSFGAFDLTTLQNKTLFAEMDKAAQEAGRKDRLDLRVGDEVVMAGNPGYLYGGKPYVIAAKSGNNWIVNYWDMYYKRYSQYGNYLPSQLLLYKAVK
jgi:hypothetical protein